jgi:hypothetical protein
MQGSTSGDHEPALRGVVGKIVQAVRFDRMRKTIVAFDDAG